MRRWRDYVRPRLFTGDLILPTCRRAARYSVFFPKMVIIYTRRKHHHLLGGPPPPLLFLHLYPPGATWITLYPARFLNSTLASVYRLSLHISFGTGDRTPRISLLPSWQSCRWNLHVFAQVKCSYNAKEKEEASSRWLHSIRRRLERKSDRIRTRFPSARGTVIRDAESFWRFKCDAPS